MNDTKNFTTEAEDRIIEDAFREVLDGYLKSNHRKKVEIIERAFKFAKEAHKGIRRRSGEPYILHPIAVAKNRKPGNRAGLHLDLRGVATRRGRGH